MFQGRYQRHTLCLILLRHLAMNLERLEWTLRPRHKRPKLDLQPRTRSVYNPDLEVPQRRQGERVQEAANLKLHYEVEGAKVGVRECAQGVLIHVLQLDVHTRKGKVLEVRIEREEGEHDRTIHVVGALDPQLREVRPALLQRRQHARAEHDPVKKEDPQSRLGLDDHYIWVRTKVTRE